MKILFLGYAVPEQIMDKLSGCSVAGNKMQLNIIKQIFHKVEELKIVTVYPIAVWPRDKKILVTADKLELDNGIYAERVAFFNFPLLKQIFQIFSVYFAAAKYLNGNKDVIVLTFNSYPQVGIPARWLKKNFHVIPILADLPIDDSYYRTGISKILRNLFDNSTKKTILQSDRVIVLNKNARDIFAPDKEYLVIEGGVNKDDYKYSNTDGRAGMSENVKNIVYCGSLSEYSGVKNLVDAMQFINDRAIVLDIYGDGYFKDYIQTKQSGNIRYHGSVPNVEMLKIQQEAWLLVNPRPIDDPIAMVTFPSKIFEYLMSGTPVLSTRLNGFTDEYDGKLFFAESNAPEELARCINTIDLMEKEELVKRAEAARSFVLEEKNWEKQVDKLVKFLSELPVERTG